MAPKKKTDGNDEPTGCAKFGRVKNNLKMGIVGLPNVGKSSLFNLLCDMEAAAENFPFCTIDPTESRCAVPDERFDHLVKVYGSKPIPSFLNVTDIAGLVKGASEGAGLGNAFLSNIQAVDGIFHVVRAFEDKDVLHVEDSVDSVRDLEVIQHELCAKDLEYVNKCEEQTSKDIKAKKVKLPDCYQPVLEKVRDLLTSDKPIATGHSWSSTEVCHIRDFYPNLITTKPVIYLVNCSVKQFVTGNNKFLEGINQWVSSHGGGSVVPFSVKFEQGLFQNRDNEEKLADIRKKSGKDSMIPDMIRAGYSELNLINFFTCGPMEVRSWTVYNGATAPQAAGVIHTDFEKCFIKAEVCGFEDFKSIATKSSMEEVKAAGKYRVEGKHYIMQAGDIVHFMHNKK
eukprot:GHVH01008807.1.p1 GENE.GHVH01008807.1~~GHVH01008807.1.p1  ORF type:complete len:398 (+),score=90.79 GHVH01008807.1:50-1243(+)